MLLRSTRVARTGVLIAAFLCWSMSPVSAQGAGETSKSHKRRKAKAKKAYAEGRELWNAEDYDGALEAFERAQELDPQPAYVFNIAQSHRLRGDCESAEERYRAFLRSSPSTPNRDDVEGWIEEMKTCREEREREEEASAEDEEAAEEVDEPPPEEAEPRGEDEPEEEEGSAGAVEIEVDSEDNEKSPVGLWVAGGGAAALGVGIYFGMRARAASSEIDSLLASGGVFDAKQQNIQARGQRDEKISIALGSVGGAMLVGGLIYYFLSSDGGEKKPKPSSLQVHLDARGDGARAGLGWVF